MKLDGWEHKIRDNYCTLCGQDLDVRGKRFQGCAEEDHKDFTNANYCPCCAKQVVDKLLSKGYKNCLRCGRKLLEETI